jgi:hypothetical protein
MWEAFVVGIGWETRTFRSWDEAEVWVRGMVKEKFNLDLP